VRPGESLQLLTNLRAGQRHAIQLLLQGNSAMAPEKAQSLAENLYAHTKGKNTHRTDMFNGKFWFGGSESFVINKLEGIALFDRPQTPALGCGVTSALSSAHLTPGFGTDYMTSRINWAVQSSGVDYLHLLIVAMEHITKAYGIDARYLLSFHDEVRYLVLQIANLGPDRSSRTSLDSRPTRGCCVLLWSEHRSRSQEGAVDVVRDTDALPQPLPRAFGREHQLRCPCTSASAYGAY
jgi:hypothetical protein